MADDTYSEHMRIDRGIWRSFDTVNITEVPKIEELYATYRTSFADLSATNKSGLQRAKRLIVSIPEHYLMSTFGWTILDKKRVLATTKKHNQDVPRPFPAHDMSSVARRWGTGQFYHHIAPENIAGYAVHSTLDFEEPGGSTSRTSVPHTIVGIMMDDLSTFSDWIADDKLPRGKNTVTSPRAELLSSALGVEAGIQDGYGIIVLGPRIEMYTYKRET
ncbi:hypothetical protein K458DRAFT_384619 [Lentithecium fluviatile CBS 122367]|uniref:Uncharacterized protein n=1 Tax=Lentithecium fluviatile CBS 122367 TaxID=1168545 RepID=A0A6G1JE38_9PLEO|nr:hypothetical protein K458DRAFT_384619 [Lentithecium fluviatile CBS 122367]